MRTPWVPALVLLFLPLATQAQWVEQQSGTPTNLTDVAALDSVTAIAVGRDGSILKTTDAGETWVNLPLLPLFYHPWNAVSFSSQHCGAVCGDFGRVVTTTDGGDNWSWHSVPHGGKLLCVLQLSPFNLYAGNDSGWIFHSTDSGQTWLSDSVSAFPVRSIFPWTGGFTDWLPLFALTPYSIFSGRDSVSSEWKETPLGAFLGLGSQAFRGVFAPGGDRGFIVGVWGDFRAAPAVVRKLFPDSVWRPSASGLLGNGGLSGVSAPSPGTVYVCGDQGMLGCSKDGGDSWSNMTSPNQQKLNAISFSDTLRGWAVGDSGTILFTSNGGTTSAGNGRSPLPQRPMLEQNYPNPFNPTTEIEYTVGGFRSQASGFSTVRLVVYDLLGRKVATMVNEQKPAGTYTVRFDGSALSSGVYFYRLDAGNDVLTRKMVLTK